MTAISLCALQTYSFLRKLMKLLLEEAQIVPIRCILIFSHLIFFLRIAQHLVQAPLRANFVTMMIMTAASVLLIPVLMHTKHQASVAALPLDSAMSRSFVPAVAEHALLMCFSLSK